MKHPLIVFLISGVTMLAGYQVYCWATHLNSYLFFALPLLVLYVAGFAFSYWASRKAVALGRLPLRVEFLDRCFLVGGLVANILALGCLLIHGRYASHYS